MVYEVSKSGILRLFEQKFTKVLVPLPLEDGGIHFEKWSLDQASTTLSRLS